MELSNGLLSSLSKGRDLSNESDHIALVVGMIVSAFQVSSSDARRYLIKYAQHRKMGPAELAAQLADQWDQYVSHLQQDNGVVAIDPFEQMETALRTRGITLTRQEMGSRYVIDDVIIELRRELIKPVPTHWHHERPHEIGRYWYRGPEYREGTPVIVLVDYHEEHLPLSVAFGTGEGETIEIFAVESLSGEWAEFK